MTEITALQDLRLVEANKTIIKRSTHEARGKEFKFDNKIRYELSTKSEEV